MKPSISAKTMLARNPSLLDPNSWPIVDTSAWKTALRKEYQKRYQMMVDYCDGESVDNIAEAYGLSGARIYQIVNKFFGSFDEQPPLLTYSLKPNTPIQEKKQRRSPLPTLQNPSGASGSFQKLLETVDGLKDHLLNAIKLAIKDAPEGENISIKRFFQKFTCYLKERNYPLDQYPFTHEKQGYESLRQWLHRQIAKLRASPPSDRAIMPKCHIMNVLESVQLDEQLYDASASVLIILNGATQKIRIARCTLIMEIDKATEYILGHSFILCRHCDQDDVLVTINKMYCPAQRELSSSHFEYHDITKEQQAAINYLPHIQLGELALDNALSHHANTIYQHVTGKLKATIHFGLVKAPKARNLIEHAFKLLGDDAHRNKATPGSHPKDPKKESSKNYKKAPVVLLNELEDMIAVLIAQLNARKRRHLGGESPIERLTRLIAEGAYWRQPKMDFGEFGLHTRTMSQRTLHVSTSECRLPYFNFKKVRYRLINNVHPIPQSIKITGIYHSQDIRLIKIYDENGKFLGDGQVPKSWSYHPHSVKTRRYVLKYVSQSDLKLDDPVGRYYLASLEKTHQPSGALEVVRLHNEITTLSIHEPVIYDSQESDVEITEDIAQYSTFKNHSVIANHEQI